uniref:DUF5641 domain-containing protein n=1 Tax=Syphacia muris TaxID=451379 RepID=A0A0N5ACP3_9BILA
LRERSPPQKDLRKYREPGIDEVVLLKEPKVPKFKWRIARVMNIIRNKQGKISCVERPLESLFCLEVPNDPELSDRLKSKADPNLDEEEPELLALNIESNTSSIKKNKAAGIFWTSL